MILKIVNFNYGSKNKNPLENVKFYSKYSPDSCFSIEKDQVKKKNFKFNFLLNFVQFFLTLFFLKVSSMLLNVFEDTVMRVFSKMDDINFIKELSQLFYDWSKSKKYQSPLYGRLTN
jgi:hypothetical protein